MHITEMLHRLIINKIKRTLFLTGFLFPLLLNSAKLPNVHITGINGPLLLNVQHRLSELYKGKSIAQQPLDEVHTQVEKALYPFGFFKTNISMTTSDDQLQIKVSPGPRLHITTMEAKIIGDGASNADLVHALHNLPIHVGQPFENELYEQAKNNLTSAAEDQGYLHAFFETSQLLIDKSRYTAAIVLILNTGPRYYFGQIKFDPTNISPELLHRFVPFKFGEPYSTAQVLKLNSNLASSGYFNTVNVNPAIGTTKDVPLEVTLHPAKRINYSVGVGYGTDTGPRGRLGLSVIPVNRAGHKFNAIAQGSMVQNTVQGQYIIPGANPVNDNYSITGGLTNLNYSAGRSQAVLLGLAQQHVVTNYQRTLSLNGLNERYNYTNFPTFSETVVFPKAVLTWSKTTDPLFSPSGYKITFNGLAASKALLSQVSLAQASIDARAAYSIDVIRTRLYLHGIQGFTEINNIQHLPLSLAQLLGGAEDLKGYSFNSIGPGRISSYAGIEIQKETVNKLYFLGFVDAGNVYNPTTKNTKYDTGIGIMWVSPVGPIKIVVAQAINHNFQRTPDHKPKLVINIGPDL